MTSPKPSRKTKADLKPNNETFRLLFANHPIPMWIYDLKTLAFLDVNDAAAEKYGYTRDEFLALTLKDIRPEEDIEHLSKTLKQKRPALHHSGEWRHRLKNGHIIDVEITTHTLDFEEHKAALVMAQDITERKHAKEELIQNEAKFRSTFDQSPVGSVIVGLDKHFIRCNSAFCNFLGYPESELIGKTISDITHPEDLEIGMKELKQMVEGKIESYTIQKRYLRKDGAVLWGEISIRLVRDANNEPLYFLPIIQNITERKQAEKALKESEKRFATIFRANPAAIAMTRLDDGHLVDVNAAWQRMTGYVYTEVVGRTVQELNLWVIPEQRERLMEMLGEQGKAHGEMELRCKSGDTRDLLMSADLIELDGKRYLLTMAQDITEQKRKDEGIRNAHKRIDSMLKFTTSIISAIPTPVFYKDREGRYLGVNGAFAELMGYTPDFYVGKTVMELWPDDVAKVYWEKDLELMRNPERQVYEFKVMDKDGMTHPVIWGKNVFRDENGQVAGIVGAFVDITERKQAEDALRESEEKYRQIVDTAGEGIWMIDAEGNTTFANQKMTEMLGYSAGEMLGVSFFTFMDEDGKALAAANVERRRQGIKEQHDFKFRRKDGTDLWAILETNPIVDKDGRYAGALAMLTDITERMQAEEALRESEVKLQDVFNLMQEGMALNELVFDEQGEIVDYRILEVNPAYERISTLTREQVVGKKATEIYGMSSAYIKEFWRQNQHAVHNIITEYYVPQINQWRMISTSAPVDNKFTTIFSDITERKLAEDALRESEARLRLITDNMVDLIAQFDTQAFFQYASPSYEKILGYRAEDLIGKSAIDLLHPDERGEIIQSIDEMLRLGTGAIQFRYRHKDGSYRWIESTGRNLLNADGQVIGSAMGSRDITERKQAEESLQMEKANLDAIFESSPVAMFILDETTNIVQINAAAVSITGGSDSDALQHRPGNALRCIHSSKDPRGCGYSKECKVCGVRNGVETLIANGGTIHAAELELDLIRNGAPQKVWMSIGAEPIQINDRRHVCVAMQDITERKQTEKTLRDTSDRLTHMLANSPTVIYALKVEGGEAVPTWISDNINTVMGFSAEDGLKPEWWTQQIYPEDRPEALASLNHLFDDFYQHEYRFLRKDGSVIWLHDEHRLLRDEDNKSREIVGAWTDITEHKQAEEILQGYNARLEDEVRTRTRELCEAQEKLVRNEKLAVLGQLAGSVGHELRNPLAVINNALYYLKLIGADSSEKVKEYLGIIQTESRIAEKIITDLLDFARIKSVDVEPVSVSYLVARVLGRYPAPKEMNVRLEIPEDLPKLYVGPRQMEQVLGNLVVNACQAMTIGGDSTGGELTITAQQEQEMIAITVKDTGVGIPPENMKKLFEPLFTTKAKGIGLGLAVSQKLAEANGGRIEVQSEAGVGSMFTVYLPVKQ